MPAATTTSASPHWMACAASITALRLDPQTLLTVVAPIACGSPAAMAACRVTFWPRPAGRTLPPITSSTWSGAIPARSSAALMAMPPSCGAGTLQRALETADGGPHAAGKNHVFQHRWSPPRRRAARTIDKRRIGSCRLTVSSRAVINLQLTHFAILNLSPLLPPTPLPGPSCKVSSGAVGAGGHHQGRLRLDADHGVGHLAVGEMDQRLVQHVCRVEVGAEQDVGAAGHRAFDALASSRPGG